MSLIPAEIAVSVLLTVPSENKIVGLTVQGRAKEPDGRDTEEASFLRSLLQVKLRTKKRPIRMPAVRKIAPNEGITQLPSIDLGSSTEVAGSRGSK